MSSHQSLAKVAEEITLSEQALGAWLVENDLGVHRVGHLEAYLQRQVRLDQPGDDQAVGSLRRKHEVDTGGAALTGDSGHQRLELLLILASSKD